MSSSGVLVYDFTTGTMNGDKFYTFVCAHLIPCMQEFPALNSILVMDNCSIHSYRRLKTFCSLLE